MSTTCPQGHESDSSDYCDVCGSPMTAPAGIPSWAAGSAGTGRPGAHGGEGQGGTEQGGTEQGGSSGAGQAAEPTRCPHCDARARQGAFFCEACGYDFTTGALPPEDGFLVTDPRVPSAVPAQAPAVAAPAADSAVRAPDAPPQAPDAEPAAPASETGGEPTAFYTEIAAEPVSEAQTPIAPAAARTPRQAETATRESAPRPERETWVAEVWVDPDWHAEQESGETCPSPAAPDVAAIHDRALIGRRSLTRGIAPDVDAGLDSGVSRRHAELSTDGRRWWIEDLGSSNGTYVARAVGPLPLDPITPGQRVEVGVDDRIYLGAWTRVAIRPATRAEAEQG